MPDRDPARAAVAKSKDGKTGDGMTMLDPATMRLGLSVPGNLAASVTGYDGFAFTDRELDDLAKVWAQVQVPLSPTSQAVAATVAVVAMKIGGYMAFKKRHGRREPAPTVEQLDAASPDDDGDDGGGDSHPLDGVRDWKEGRTDDGPAEPDGGGA